MEIQEINDDENNLLLLQSPSKSSLKRAADNDSNQEISSEKPTNKKVKVVEDLPCSFTTNQEKNEIISSHNDSLIEAGSSQQESNSVSEVKKLNEPADEMTNSNTDKLLINLENHDEFYKAIRSNNCKFFKNFIENHDLDHKNVIHFLVNAYKKLKLNNVPLLDNIQMGVEGHLNNLRFEYNKSDFDTNKYSITTNAEDEVKKRIDMIIEITKHFEEYFDKDNKKEVDIKFLFLCTTIARHLHILKKQLRITYDKLPWEEMEFYLICFVSSYTKFEEINWVYNTVLDTQNLYFYLKNFTDNLEQLKHNIGKKDINKNFNNLNLNKIEPERNQIKNKVINNNKNFISLYDDFKQIKNIYSLNKIRCYIELALYKTIDKKLDYLAIERALQITGEYLKDTLESPNLSSDINKIITLTFHCDTKRILTKLRNNLSHVYISKECLLNKKMNARKYQLNFKNDLTKLKNTIENILYEIKIEMIRKMLKKISNIETIKEAETFPKIFYTSDILSNLRFELINTREFDMIKSLIEDYKTEIEDLTEYEKKQFDKIHEILQYEIERNANYNKNYEETVLLLIKLFFSIVVQVNIEKVKDMAQTFLSCLEEKRIHNNKFYELILNRIGRIQKSVESRLDDDNLKDLYYEISIHIVLKVGEIDSIRKFKDEFEKKEKGDEIQDKINEFLIDLYKRLGDNCCISIREIFEAYKELGSITKSGVLYDLEKFERFLEKINIGDGTKIEFVNHFKGSQWSELVKKLPLNPYRDFMKCIQKFLKDNKFGPVKTSFEKLCLKLDDSVENKLKAVLNEIDEEKKLKKHFEQTLNLLKYALKDKTITKYKNYFDKLDPIYEILLLDIFAYVEEELECLSSNEYGSHFFLDKSIPTPLGKQLRNYLAHGNPLLDILPCISKVSIMLNINQIIEKSENLKQIEKVENKVPFVLDEPPLKIEYLKQCFNLNVETINNQQKMFSAIKQDDLHTVQDCLKQGADIYGRDINDCNVLHYACEYNSKNTFKFLLNLNLVDDINKFGEKPLHVAVKNGNEDIVTYCLENQIIDVKNYFSEQGLSLLYNAAMLKQKVLFNIIFKFWNNGENIYQFIEERENCEDGVDISFMITNKKKSCGDCLCKKYISENVNTILHASIVMQDLELLEYIIKNGANVNAKNKRGLTPLHVAVLHNHVDCIELLLKYEEDIDVNIKNDEGLTPLQLATQKEAVNCLLKSKNIDLNCKNIYNYTLLHTSAEKGNQSILEIYLSDKVKLDINCKTDLGLTPLMCAARMGHTHIVKYLSERHEIKFECKDNEGLTVLHFAARNGNKKTLDVLLQTSCIELINCKDIYGLTPLHYAAFDGNESAVETLIVKGLADIECLGDEKNSTPLHLACENGHDTVVNIIITKAPKVNVNCIDKYGLTPLHHAVFFGYKKVVEALIECKNVKINIIDKEKLTPIHYACNMGDEEILNLLLNKLIIDFESKVLKESDISIIKCNLLHIAAMKGRKNIIELILNKLKIDINCKSEEERRTALHFAALYGQDTIIDFLLNKEAEVNCKTENNNTPLLYAVEKGHYNIVEKLLNVKDIDVNCTDLQGLTPLHVAVDYKHIKIVELLLKDSRVKKNMTTTETNLTPLLIAIENNDETLTKLLINFENTNINYEKLDINYKNCDGYTPLHIATQNRFKEIVKILIEHNDCDVNCQNDVGLTPLQIATNSDYQEIVELLNMKMQI